MTPNDAPQTFVRPDGSTIAYRRLSGKSPGVVFLTGFKSDMTGSKALVVYELCRQRGQACLLFDYTGHGASSGAFEDGTIGRWADDAMAAFDALTEGPQVLVGSSMGGWIMLLVALARSSRIAALLGIAAAPDFTHDLVLAGLSQSQRRALAANGVLLVPSHYSEEPTPITARLVAEGGSQLVLRRGVLPLEMPVRLLHGQDDSDVPWQTSLRLAAALASADVQVTLLKDGDHRLSRPQDLTVLATQLELLLKHVDHVDSTGAAEHI